MSKRANWIQTGDWKQGEKIGSGAFGEVFKCLAATVRSAAVCGFCVFE